jgi:hypothetical protein
MVAAADGTLYVGEWNFLSPDANAGLYVFSPSGTESLVTSMDPGISGLDLDGAGNVYVASNNSAPDPTTDIFGPDTAQQLSVYAPHATSLLRQFQDSVPGVGALAVGDDGSAYLVQFCCYASNGPATNGAIYKIAPGAGAASDFIASLNTDDVVLYNGKAAKNARSRVARYSIGHNSAKHRQSLFPPAVEFVE